MDDLFAYLYADSVFTDMESVYFFDIGSIFTSLIRAMCSMITNLLVSILNGCEYLVRSAWKVMQISNFNTDKYSKNNAAAELYTLFNNFIWIPIVVCIAIIVGKVIMSPNGKEDIKRFFSNVVVLAMALVLLPSIFTSLDNKIFNEKSSLLNANANRTASSIVFKHTTDYYYVYNKYVAPVIKNNTDASLDTYLSKKKIKKITKKKEETNTWSLSKKNSFSSKLNTNEMEKIDVTRMDLNVTIDEDNQEDLDEDVPDFFKKRLSPLVKAVKYTDDTSKVIASLEGAKTVGVRAGGFGIGDEHYYRYKTDYLAVYLELIANIILHIGAAYALVKIAIELMINRIIFGALGAADLTGGERMRKILTSIIGFYVSFMFVAFTLQLFESATTFISDSGVLKISGLAYSIIVVFLAIISLSIPDMVAKYFGVNTGMRFAGMAAAMLGYGTTKFAASRAARGASRTYSNYRKNHKSPSSGSSNSSSAAGTGPFAGNNNQNGTNATAFPPSNNQSLPAGNGNTPTTNSSSDLPNTDNKYDNLNDYKDEIAKNNPDMAENQVDKAANQRMADDNRDDIYKAAMLSQIDSGKNDKSALKDTLDNKAQGDNPMFDAQHTGDVADNLYANGKFSQYKDNAYRDISKDAKELMKSDKYAAEPMKAYEKAASNFGAQGETQKHMANIAYADANNAVIRREAKKYKMSGRNISDTDAIKHVITTNSNGCATHLDSRYADDIATNIISHGSLKGGDTRRTRNKGAGAFY